MKKILSIILMGLLFGCGGYEPIFSKKNINISICEIEINKNDKISRKLKKRLNVYSKKDTSNVKNIIELDSKKIESIITKDKKGDPLLFRMEIISNIKIINMDNKNFISNFTIRKMFDYNNEKNKFNLNQYKKQIEENLINQISEKLLINLQKFNDN